MGSAPGRLPVTSRCLSSFCVPGFQPVRSSRHFPMAALVRADPTDPPFCFQRCDVLVDRCRADPNTACEFSLGNRRILAYQAEDLSLRICQPFYQPVLPTHPHPSVVGGAPPCLLHMAMTRFVPRPEQPALQKISATGRLFLIVPSPHPRPFSLTQRPDTFVYCSSVCRG